MSDYQNTSRQHSNKKKLLAFVCGVAFACLAGCSPPRSAIEGTVTLNGQPLDEAVIVLTPLDAGTKKTGGSIRNGHYQIESKNGMLPGKYRVEILDDPPIALAHQSQAEPPHVERRKIPSQYTENSPLMVEFKSDGKSTFDFILTGATK